MFEAKSMLYLYVETPLHTGSGRGLGTVDLPIQRERVTGYPMVQASSIKGCLRATSQKTWGKNEEEAFFAVFGPDTDSASKFAGAFSVADARILLFPVRSLAGVFAWTTSNDCLQRFIRDTSLLGIQNVPKLPEVSINTSALVYGDSLVAETRVVLEEYSFTPERNDQVKEWAVWLAKNALPMNDEYNYWRESLEKKLCILPDNAFRDFVLYNTEIQTHIKLDPEKKVVATGALWTSESLPVDTLLYAPVMASPRRSEGVKIEAQEILDLPFINPDGSAKITRIQMGGDETTGQGLVMLRYARKNEIQGGV